jgi:hypothetical protein
MPLVYANSSNAHSPELHNPSHLANPASRSGRSPLSPRASSRAADLDQTPKLDTVGRAELTLEIKHTSTGFYASIESQQQLISQTASFSSSAKATQEGYRLIETLQSDHANGRHLFN